MTYDDISGNQGAAIDHMPATCAHIADELDVSQSYVRTIVYRLRNKGVPVEQDSAGRFYVRDLHDPAADASGDSTATRTSSGEKAAVTRRVRETLTEMERQLKATLDEMEPARADGGLERRPGGLDVIFHRTDDHFGHHEVNEYGDTTYDSEIAESRVRRYFNQGFQRVEERRASGWDVDTGHLLLGGDIVTNESIYEGQAHDIDENLRQQIDRAADVYIEQIRRMADTFPSVQVVCQVGNHGEIRASNSSAAANADDILYSMLDKVVRASDMDNVTFIRSDRTYFVNFKIRDWDAHLRHGHDSSLEHIGTSAGKHRWQTWLIDHDFDVAFRGHYHMLKEEPINGVPVVMGGSPCPQTDFEESQGISGRAMGAVHGATDDYPLDWTDRIAFE